MSYDKRRIEFKIKNVKSRHEEDVAGLIGPFKRAVLAVYAHIEFDYALGDEEGTISKIEPRDLIAVLAEIVKFDALLKGIDPRISFEINKVKLD